MSRSLVFALAGLMLAGVAGPGHAAPPARKASPRPPTPPVDFTGVWEIDPSMSLNVPSQMRKAILSVTQKGNRIWISPMTSGKASMIMAEEVVADGRPYEKALGRAGKGIVTATWGEDRQSLRIEVKAGAENGSDPSAIQRSIWKLSADKNVWIRESVSVSEGKPRNARLVFRRSAAAPTPAPTARRPATAKKAR